MRLLKFMGWTAAGLLLLPLLLLLGSALLTPRCEDMSASRPYDVAVVLSAGLSNGRTNLPGPVSRARTEAGIDLYRSRVVSRLLLTGDASSDPDIAVARGMRDMTLAQGVPENAVIVEDRSHSTLQNALYSRPLLEDADRILLVTSGYHLWRGALSMAWAGVPVQGMCKTSAFDDVAPRYAVENALFEIPKWWLNFGRAATWSMASGIGLQDRLPPWFLD